MSKLLVKKSVIALKASLLLAGVLSLSMVKADTLRFCSDPDNLPFSKSEGVEKGLYTKLNWLTRYKIVLACLLTINLKSRIVLVCLNAHVSI